MLLYLIPPSELINVWASISHLIDRMALSSKGKFLSSDIIKAIVGNEFQLWIATNEAGEPKSICIGRIVDFPQKRVYEPIAVTADELPEHLGAWVDMWEIIESWAKAQGCTLMQPLGRPAFEKILKGKGYRKTHVLLEKDI